LVTHNLIDEDDLEEPIAAPEGHDNNNNNSQALVVYSIVLLILEPLAGTSD
jgi:hypothetical protein